MEISDFGRSGGEREREREEEKKKRRRTSTPQDPAAVPSGNRDEHKLQCHLIHVPKAVRVINGRNKMNGQREETSVLNIVVADHTGPLHVDLWGSVGGKFWQDVAAAFYQSEEPLPIEMSYFFKSY